MHVFFRLVGLGIIIALVGILIVFTFQYNLRNLSKFFFGILKMDSGDTPVLLTFPSFLLSTVIIRLFYV